MPLSVSLLPGGLLMVWAWLLCGPAAGAEPDTILGEVGGNVTLPCRNGSLGDDKVDWFQIGNAHPVLSVKWPEWNIRFTWGNQSSLQIRELQLEEEGNYTCEPTQDVADPGNLKPQIQLLLSSGPSQTNISISPSRILPNGTLYVPSESILRFSCATHSYPVPSMEWVLFQPGSLPEPFASANDTALTFILQNIGPTYQGNYSCLVENWRSRRRQELAVELLVYNLPSSDLKCWAETAQVWPMVDLVCGWLGGYPQPVFQWRSEEKVLGSSESVIAGLGTTDQFVVTLNQTRLRSGQQFECQGSHILNNEAQTCTMHITHPTLEPQPLKTCFMGENVTLVCLTTATNPPANFTWLKNIHVPQVEIQESEKYQITQNATSSLLTIRNCSKDVDEGYLVCRAENPLGVKELDIWLTVHKPGNIVGVVTAMVILFLLAFGGITVLIVYCNPEFCVKAYSRSRGTGDVMVLMDSEDEEEVVAEERTTTDDTQDSVHAANGNIRHAVICHRVPESHCTELQSENSFEEERTKPDM